LLVALYDIISALFTSTTVLLPNYSHGNIKINSIRPVSACLTFFEVIWHFCHKWFGIFCWLRPGNPGLHKRSRVRSSQLAAVLYENGL